MLLTENNKKHYYLIGSLRNPYIPKLEASIRKSCPSVVPFADWYSAGERADDAFKEYHQGRGLSYRDAINGYAGRHIFEFDKSHLDRCDGAVLVMPSGKSCHLEAGYMVGRGKPVFALYPDGEPEDRYELMMQFLTEIFYSEGELLEYFNREYISRVHNDTSDIGSHSVLDAMGLAQKPLVRRFSTF